MKRNYFLQKKGLEAKPQNSSGYALGMRIRTSTNQRIDRLGRALNKGQQQLGIRTTQVLLVLLWMMTFYYFTNLLLSIFENL